jgi:hypothetical protein
MDVLVPVIAAVEEGGTSFILFVAMIVVVYIAMLITIAR